MKNCNYRIGGCRIGGHVTPDTCTFLRAGECTEEGGRIPTTYGNREDSRPCNCGSGLDWSHCPGTGSEVSCCG